MHMCAHSQAPYARNELRSAAMLRSARSEFGDAWPEQGLHVQFRAKAEGGAVASRA